MRITNNTSHQVIHFSSSANTMGHKPKFQNLLIIQNIFMLLRKNTLKKIEMKREQKKNVKNLKSIYFKYGRSLPAINDSF